ncbi:MAG: hypothetical protein ACK5XM_14505 [Betaproteobacteria bacterium]
MTDAEMNTQPAARTVVKRARSMLALAGAALAVAALPAAAQAPAAPGVEIVEQYAQGSTLAVAIYVLNARNGAVHYCPNAISSSWPVQSETQCMGIGNIGVSAQGYSFTKTALGTIYVLNRSTGNVQQCYGARRIPGGAVSGFCKLIY